jgi:hypothetical protein
LPGSGLRRRRRIRHGDAGQGLDARYKKPPARLGEEKALRLEQVKRGAHGLLADAQAAAQAPAGGQPGAAWQPPGDDFPGQLPVQLLIQGQPVLVIQHNGQLVHVHLWYCCFARIWYFI